MPALSIVIPNFNGESLIPDCLQSLETCFFQDFEVIVVDNGSQDASLEILKRDFPQHQLISLDKNYGFARACNEGIQAAKADLIVLLNNDIEVHPDWSQEIVSGMRRHPECVMGTSKMVFADDRTVIYNTGDEFHTSATGGGRGFGETDQGQYDREEEVFGACAGAGVYRRELFDQIGLFDEDFFIFAEDVDLNLRARYFGARCIYLPDAKVYHIGTATVGFKSDQHMYLSSRNELYLLVKNFSFSDFYDHLGAIWKRRLRLVRETGQGGQGFVMLRSLLAFLIHLPKLIQQRAQLKKRTVLSLEKVKPFLKEAK